jgi:hypothetical protein
MMPASAPNRTAGVRRSGLRLLVLCAVTVGLAGCSGSSAPGPTTTTAATAATSTTAIGIVNNPAVRTQAAIVSCRSVSGGWEASGIATNPLGNSHRYVLTVYFTDPSATVLGSGRTSVEVPGGSSRTWHVIARLSATLPVRCVLAGVA